MRNLIRRALEHSPKSMFWAERAYLFSRAVRRAFDPAGQLIDIQMPLESLPKNPQSNVLIIAPGEMAMPASGWGAVEALVWRQAEFLAAHGTKVTVLNSWNLLHWIKAFFGAKNLVVVNHYDVFARRAVFFSSMRRAPLVSVSHYANLVTPNSWDPFFKHYFRHFLRSDAIVVLSNEARLFIGQYSPRAKVSLIPNGVPVDSFRQGESSLGLICLGKVEPRKRQYETASMNLSTSVDFVGQVVDERISQLDDSVRARFLGPWSRDEVYENLHKYQALCLFSLAEGDALVLYEAQAAGLGVFVTPEALGSQDLRLPWVVPVEFSPEKIEEAFQLHLENIRSLRGQIRSHALASYGDQASFEKWASVIQELRTSLS